MKQKRGKSSKKNNNYILENKIKKREIMNFSR